MPELQDVALLAAAALAAGFVDAVVGGGGLILMPMFLLTMPADLPVPVILGTNKATAITGTSVAALRFARAGALPEGMVFKPVLAAIVGATAGSFLAYRLSPDALRPVMVALLAGMLLFVVARPALGAHHVPRFAHHHGVAAAVLISVVLGLYDGFFGPGTGAVLVFAFVAVLGFDFVRASGLAKVVNWGSNLAATTIFIARGDWIWQLAAVLALANMLGAHFGARLALQRGVVFVRIVFVLVSAALILRLGWQLLASAS